MQTLEKLLIHDTQNNLDGAMHAQPARIQLQHRPEGVIVTVNEAPLAVDETEMLWLGSLALSNNDGVTLLQRANEDKPTIDTLIKLKKTWASLGEKLNHSTDGAVVTAEFIDTSGTLCYGIIGACVEVVPVSQADALRQISSTPKKRALPSRLVATHPSGTSTLPRATTEQLIANMPKRYPAPVKTVRESIISDVMPWSGDAKCLQAEPDTFFPEKGGSTREAKKICKMCPVINECLEYALENEERFGIWGGKSERERRKLARQKPSQAA